MRLRLKQAFGRLISRTNDHGVFVPLDPMMPSRLRGAFSKGVELKRVGLAEAVAETKAFRVSDGTHEAHLPHSPIPSPIRFGVVLPAL